MITKGLIQSIDFESNTCLVRLPFFESAGNKTKIEATATFSIQPGVYGGYNVGDVVTVAFEDGVANQPVVIGKLYLGTDTENTVGVGTINCESLIVSKKATLPLDTKIVQNNSESATVNVEGGYNSYNKLSDVLDALQQNTSSISDAKIQLLNNGTELKAKVNKTTGDATTGFGWNLQDDKWTVFSAESTSDGLVKEKDILTADKNGLYIDGKLVVRKESKIAGFDVGTRAIYSEYTNDGALNEKMQELATEIEQCTTSEERDEKIDPTTNPINNLTGVYVGTDGIRIGNNFSVNSTGQVTAKGLKINLTPEQIEQLKFKIVKTYDSIESMVADWKSATETHTEPQVKVGEFVSIDAGELEEETGYVYSKTETQEVGSGEKDEPGWRYITDMAGISGIDAVAYRLASGSIIHLGKKQVLNIPVAAWSKTGSSAEVHDTAVDFKISGINGIDATKYISEQTQTLVELLTENSKLYGINILNTTCDEAAGDIVVIAYHFSDVAKKSDPVEYARETITYSPLNTPVIALTPDTGTLPYKYNSTTGADEKIGTSTTSTTADLIFNGAKKTQNVTYSWSLTNLGSTSLLTGKTIEISTIEGTAKSGTANCTITWIDESGRTWTVGPKSFVVSKQLQGEAGTGRWINVPTMVHLGKNQETDIIVTAYKQVGTEAILVDTDSVLKTTGGGKEFSSVNGVLTLTKSDIATYFEQINITINAYVKDAAGTVIISGENYKLYDTEIIDYSSGTTPIIALTGDAGQIKTNKDGNINYPSTQAKVYLGKDEISKDVTFDWNKGTKSKTTYNNDTVKANDGIGDYICTVTYKANTYTKTFKVTSVVDGQDGSNGYILDIENDFESIPCDNTGTIISGYDWNNTKHTIRAYLGLEKVSINAVGTTTPTEGFTGYWLQHTDSNVTWAAVSSTLSTTEFSAKILTLSANTGNVDYKLYKDYRPDGTNIVATGKFEATKLKPGADGKSPIKYSIIPAVNSIKIAADGTRTPAGNITAEFKQTIDTTTSSFNGWYTYYIDGSSTGTSGTGSSVTLVGSGTATKSIKIDLFNDSTRSTKVESETILVLADGQKGDQGIQGEKGDQGETGRGVEVSKTQYIYQSVTAPAPTSSSTWYDTPDEAQSGGFKENYVFWTCTYVEYTKGTPSKERKDISKNNAYALAQGKSTNYYSDTDPWGNGLRTIKVNDCWFDTGYHEVTGSASWTDKRKYIGYYIFDGSTYTKIDSGNYTDVPSGAKAYTTGALKQCTEVKADTGEPTWIDISNEIVANKVTANYVNALDITAQKIKVTDGDSTVLYADAKEPDKTQIGGFNVNKTSLYGGTDADKVCLQYTRICTACALTTSTAPGTITWEPKKWQNTAWADTTTGELVVSEERPNVAVPYFKIRYHMNGLVYKVSTACNLSMLATDKDYSYLALNMRAISGVSKKIQLKDSASGIYATYTLPDLSSADSWKNIKIPVEDTNWRVNYAGKDYTIAQIKSKLGWDTPTLLEHAAKLNICSIICSKYSQESSDYDYIDFNPIIFGKDTSITTLTITDIAADKIDIWEPISIYSGSAVGSTAPFSVTTTGKLYSTSGKIGGFTISEESLSRNVLGEDGSIVLSTGTKEAVSIGGSASISNWVLAAGKTFGVNSTSATSAKGTSATTWHESDTWQDYLAEFNLVGGLYTREEITESSEKYIGYLREKTDTGTYYKYILGPDNEADFNTKKKKAGTFGLATYKFANNAAKGTDTSGQLYATAGKIGDFTITTPSSTAESSLISSNSKVMLASTQSKLDNVRSLTVIDPAKTSAVFTNISSTAQILCEIENDGDKHDISINSVNISLDKNTPTNTKATVTLSDTIINIANITITVTQGFKVNYSGSLGYTYSSASINIKKGSKTGTGSFSFNPSIKNIDQYARKEHNVWKDMGNTQCPSYGPTTIDDYNYPWSRLIVDGGIRPQKDNKYGLGCSGSRWKDVWAGTGTIQTSDKNQKNNITQLSSELKYETLFDNLTPVSYKFIDNTSDRTHIGFIAQDVEQAIADAQLTTQDFAGIIKDTDTYGLRYSEFIALNTDQIQKIKKRVLALELENTELKERLLAIEQKLNINKEQD